MSKIEHKFKNDFEKTFSTGADFNKIKSQINYNEIIKPKKSINFNFFAGFASGFATVLAIVFIIILFNNKTPSADNEKTYVSLMAYNKVLTSVDKETEEDVFLNFVNRDPLISNDGDVMYVSNYYIVIYFNQQGSNWGEYVGDSSINQSNILEYLKIESLERYITLSEEKGEVFIKFDNISKVIVSKYMPEIFELVETTGVSKVEFSIQLDPLVGEANE